jgi:cytochrome c heme-lyase
MPPPNQLPAPDQKLALSTERIVSTIPRAGAETPVESDSGRWMYPSPQMFYNAMKRKHYDPKEEDMDTIVKIHNAVNERAWQEVLEWERLYQSECCCPKLVRFRGRPRDFTIRARINMLLGYNAPFDRHDWVVDRCGKEVTYIIDFYQGNKPMSVFLDVRPAPTPSGVFDRARKALFDLLNAPMRR